MKKSEIREMAFGSDYGKIHGVFLLSAEESDENCISFKIALGKLGKKGDWTEEAKGNKALTELFREATPVYPDENEVYEITFEDYLLNQTRNESYASYDENEIRKGNPLIIFEKSRLLDLLPQLTDCTAHKDGNFYPAKWSHYGIYCENHIIDVISCIEPKIRKISQSR